MHLKIGKLQVIHNPRIALTLIVYGSHWFDTWSLIRPFRRALIRARECLPFFHTVSLFDCDTARYFGRFPLWSANRWHLERQITEIDRNSDGPARFDSLTFCEYVAERRAYHKARVIA